MDPVARCAPAVIARFHVTGSAPCRVRTLVAVCMVSPRKSQFTSLGSKWKGWWLLVKIGVASGHIVGLPFARCLEVHAWQVL